MRSFVLFLAGTFLIVFNSSSQKVSWVNHLVGSSHDFINKLRTDTLGNVYITGSFREHINADPRTGQKFLYSNGQTPVDPPADILFAKYSPSGDLIWAQSMGGNWQDYPRDLLVDRMGNLYICGAFSDTVDFDPGPDSAIIRSRSTMGFISKYDTAGNFKWVKNIMIPPGNVANSILQSMEFDQLGNVVVFGSFDGVVLFDSSLVTKYDTGYSYYEDDRVILKYDTAGKMLWHKHFIRKGTRVTDLFSKLKIDKSGNIYVSGAINSMNPVGVIIGLNPKFPNDTFKLPGKYGNYSYVSYIMKLTSSGDLIWGKLSTGYIDFDFSGDNIIKMISTGSGMNSDTSLLFWPGTVFDTIYKNTSKIYCLDTGGNIIRTKIINNSVYNIYIDKEESYYFTFTSGFNGIFGENFSSNANYLVVKFDSSGRFQWGVPNKDFYGFIYVDNNLNFYPYGAFDESAIISIGKGGVSINTTGIGDEDIVFAKIKEDSYIVLDSFMQLGCSNSGKAKVFYHGGKPPYTYTWNTNPPVKSSSITFDTAGLYTVTAKDSTGTGISKSFIFRGPNFSSGYDLDLKIWSTTVIPGKTAYIYTSGINATCNKVSGKLWIQLGRGLTYQKATPKPFMISGDTLFWSFDSLNYESKTLDPVIIVKADTTLQINDTVWINGRLVSLESGENDTTNNMNRYSAVVVGAYDPNAKQVFPKGEDALGNIAPAQTLSYFITFQNTGNASASRVIVVDTISSNLDLRTLRMTASSHPAKIELNKNNVVKFVFDNIDLEDSLSDESNSHGYVQYSIEPNKNLAEGTIIKNKADIYFDYNVPVITNTVENRIQVCLGYSVTIGLKNNQLAATANNAITYYWINCDSPQVLLQNNGMPSFTPTSGGWYAVSVSSKDGCTDTSDCFNFTTINTIGQPDNSFISVYPSPASDKLYIEHHQPFGTVTILDLSGSVVIAPIRIPKEGILDIANLPKGLYIINLQSGNVNTYSRFIKL